MPAQPVTVPAGLLPGRPRRRTSTRKQMWLPAAPACRSRQRLAKMSEHNGAAPPPQAAAAVTTGGSERSVVADYTESVVALGARRPNFRMLLTFGSMQLVFGAVLVGYSARFEGLSLGRLILAMAIAAV